MTACVFPALTSDCLRHSDSLIDNIFADLWKQVGMKTLLARCGFHKRPGIEVNPILYCLTMWGCLCALIAAAIEETKPVLADKADLVMQTTDLHVPPFLCKPFSLAHFSHAWRPRKSSVCAHFRGQNEPRLAIMQKHLTTSWHAFLPMPRFSSGSARN